MFLGGHCEIENGSLHARGGRSGDFLFRNSRGWHMGSSAKKTKKSAQPRQNTDRE